MDQLLFDTKKKKKLKEKDEERVNEKERISQYISREALSLIHLTED